MSSAGAARRPAVLIVEDDLLIRIDAAQIIEEAALEVIEASNADEAIAILEARSDITVLFTDIQMPGSIDGLKLAAAVKGRWPPIKIVATSGLVNVRQDDLPQGGRFLPKPYNPGRSVLKFRDVFLLRIFGERGYSCRRVESNLTRSKRSAKPSSQPACSHQHRNSSRPSGDLLAAGTL
jgi:CheY-like chemotaxis protein